jgi:hypothetical protein
MLLNGVGIHSHGERRAAISDSKEQYLLKKVWNKIYTLSINNQTALLNIHTAKQSNCNWLSAT